MTNLWTNLLPLVIGSAVVPVQIVITIILLRRSLRTAAAWVAGMAAVRLVQGILFGVLFADIGRGSGSADGSGVVTSTLLLVFAVLFYVTVLKQLLADEDPDAPPPKWMARVESMSAASAFGIGAAYVAISPKFWVFTLGAIGVIADASISEGTAVLTFLLFVVLALSFNLGALTFAAVAPEAAASALGRFSQWLEDNNRVITIVLGLVFGTWFLFKALSGFGVF